ncbi:hypothetical protein BHM03_00059805, partial [Ensete ventricosum]
ALTLFFTLRRHRRRRCPCVGVGAARSGRQPPCQGATTLAASVVAPTGGSPLQAHCGQPLAGAPWAAPYGCVVGSLLRAGRWQPPLRAGRNRSCPRVAAPCELLPLRATAPCRWPAAPLQGGLGCNRPPPCRGPWPQPTAPYS